MLEPLFALRDSLLARKKPIIMSATNPMRGGAFELALYADVVFASQCTSFALPEVRLGMLPGLGGTTLLPKVVGQMRSLLIALGGRALSAQEALKMGIVSSVFAKETEAIEAAERFAVCISSAPRDAVAACIHEIRAGTCNDDSFVALLSSVRLPNAHFY